MGIFNSNENRIKCGKCNTEFDLNKNNNCPLCGFGSKKGSISLHQDKKEIIEHKGINYLSIPSDLKLKSIKPTVNEETKAVGSWGMFNSFFPGKAVLRILANMLNEKKVKFIILNDLIKKTSDVFQINNLSKLRGFPNEPRSASSMGRLVYHFIKTFNQMGFFEVKSKEKSDGEVWNEPWTNIEITLTKEGLEFSKLRSKVFDEQEPNQILTLEEKKWLLGYLKSIDKDYKEFSMLKAVFEFIKEGHNGKDELWKWFTKNENFLNYVKTWSRKSKDAEAFEKQIENLAPTFAAGKIALLRELGVIKNKRNDYTIIGELR